MRIWILLAVLAAAPCWADESASPSPEPSLGPSDVPMMPVAPSVRGVDEATIKKCVAVTNHWKDLAGQAESALEDCRFQRFHKFCEEAHRISEEEKGPHSQCRKVLEKKGGKFPEISCVFVKVPDHCGKE